MKLAIILVILAFCFCGSNANVNRCICVQPDEMGPQIGDMNIIRPRPGRREPAQDMLEDPKNVQEKENSMTRETKKGFTFGGGNITPPRPGRSLLKPQAISLLQKYYGEPKYTSGYEDYDAQEE